VSIMALLSTGHSLKRQMLTRSYSAALGLNPAHFKVFTKYAKRGGLALFGAVAFAGVAAACEGAVSADELALGHTHWHWSHKGKTTSHDHAALRRGFQVYKEVCQACHSMEHLAWRHHINVTHTEDEIKEFAAEYMYPEINDDGDVVERPGKPNDTLPSPYPNEIKARVANNGAVPPDLSLIILAREGGEDYLFSLLMGYEPVPPGQKEPGEGQAYNPTMHGYYLAMAQQIYNESVDYEDGTIPYASQISKDVTQYYAWACDPFVDERKLWGVKAITTLCCISMILYLAKRQRFNITRSQQFVMTAMKKPPRA